MSAPEAEPTAGGFPRDLLAASEQARRDYFEAYVVEHRLMREAIAQILHHFHWSPRNSLVFFVGPTGAGKTTARLRIQELLTEESRAEMERDPGRIPVIGVPAIAGHAHAFGWGDFYTRCMIALNEPLIDRKVVRRYQGGPVSGPPTIDDKRRFLENAYRHRGTRVCLIDEAQHATKMASGKKLLDQLDCFKSMADEGGVAHGLFGTYDLLNWRTLNGQLRRRSPIVELRRYRRDDAADVQEFCNILAGFQKHLPLHKEPKLLPHWEFCMQRSIGCIGILKDWLTSALGAVLDRGGRTLTAEDLKAYAPSAEDAVGWIKEAQKGEKVVAARNSPGMNAELNKLLGMDGVQMPEDDAGEGGGTENAIDGTGATRSGEGLPRENQRRQSGRRGVRNPRRDPVGTTEAEDPDAA